MQILNDNLMYVTGSYFTKPPYGGSDGGRVNNKILSFLGI